MTITRDTTGYTTSSQPGLDFRFINPLLLNSGDLGPQFFEPLPFDPSGGAGPSVRPLTSIPRRYDGEEHLGPFTTAQPNEHKGLVASSPDMPQLQMTKYVGPSSLGVEMDPDNERAAVKKAC